MTANQSPRWLRYLAIITVIGTYTMLIMGAIVSKTESGRGCGSSWPFCHGQLIPETLPLETVIEYSHRIVSGGVGFLILLLTIFSWMLYKQNQKVKLLAGMSLFFVVLQGGLGALTVVFRGGLEQKAALALHFGFSLISFASVVLLTIYLFQLAKNKAFDRDLVHIPSGLKVATWGLTFYTYLVVYTGALVRHAEATMGCGYSFPACGVTYFPNLSSIAGIQMLHRYAAISLWLVTLWFLLVVIRKYKHRSDLVKGSIWAFVLITLQAISGIITIQLDGQVMAALVHTTIISIYFCILSYLCMQVGLPWRRSSK
ncbi:heme A synthase [Hazenella sp. IB182353]|uniref:COX15/CtaA family protein n=1 Tax=Polycladospora coralii TaxID=2771432 RepID=UPI001745FA09|nr:heme A synthase [Polycladospora coralii]MBS7530985.1 heme A synthase [Polycladospora coralii]